MSAEATESLPTELPSEAVIFGCTAAMREVRAKIEIALCNATPVLIQGESGTGKELVARFLHANSMQSGGPFVKLNCAAMTGNLLRGELFGYEQGAFPGIKESKKGALEHAEGGTLFLDEVSEMGWELQASLLRVLQDGHFSRVGGGEELAAQVRVICSTRSDLDVAAARFSFRQDLLSFFSDFRVRLLPLRERRADIPLLCDYLLDKLARSYRKAAPRLSRPALQILQEWDWPGNMRELENWIARIVVFGTEEVLGLELSRQLAVMSAIEPRHHRIAHSRSGIIKRVRRRRSD